MQDRAPVPGGRLVALDGPQLLGAEALEPSHHLGGAERVVVGQRRATTAAAAGSSRAGPCRAARRPARSGSPRRAPVPSSARAGRLAAHERAQGWRRAHRCGQRPAPGLERRRSDPRPARCRAGPRRAGVPWRSDREVPRRHSRPHRPGRRRRGRWCGAADPPPGAASGRRLLRHSPGRASSSCPPAGWDASRGSTSGRRTRRAAWAGPARCPRPCPPGRSPPRPRARPRRRGAP